MNPSQFALIDENVEYIENSSINIYDALVPGENVPEGFNAVLIRLNGQIDSDLNWKKAIHAADHYVSLGLKLLWHLDLGLFTRLSQPLSDQTQYLSLAIAIEHFKEKILNRYKESSIGISLYRGSLDFSRVLRWDSDLLLQYTEWYNRFSYPLNESEHLRAWFCMEVATQYLKLLTRKLPGDLASYVWLDCNGIYNPILLSLLSRKENFESLRGLSNYSLALSSFSSAQFGSLSRERLLPMTLKKAKIGICLFSAESLIEDEVFYQEILDFLLAKKLHFRFLSESFLTNEWQGIDDLIILTKGLERETIRKLRGFCAAGGRVISYGNFLNLSDEQSFQEWKKNYEGI